VGLSPDSPIKDHTAALKKGDGLVMVMLPSDSWTDVQPHTLSCIYTLEATAVSLQRNSGEPIDNAVNDALEPVLKFCQEMATYTRQTVQSDSLSSSHEENIADLKAHMTMCVEEIMNQHPDCFKDTSIHQLFGNFHDGELPDLVGTSFPRRTPRVTQQMLDDEDEDLQRALQESLSAIAKAKDAAIDEHQRDIQQYYIDQGGENANESGAGLGDVPQLEEVLQELPDDGVTFKDLVVQLNIFNHDGDMLQTLADGLFTHARVADGKLYPAQQDEARSDLPSDQQVREALWNSASKVDMLTLYKILNVREKGTAACLKFQHGLFSRKVVMETDEGWLKVVPQTGSGTAAHKTPGSRRGSLTFGSPFDNMPSLPTPTRGQTTPDPAKAGSAEHRPASRQQSVISDLPASAQGLVAMSKLPGEMVRVRAAVVAHLRHWRRKFPQPTECTWIQLSSTERNDILRHVTSYIHTNSLVDNQDENTKKHTINQLLTNDPAFPIAKGKNVKAITSAVKKFYQELTKKLSDQVSKGIQGNDDDDAGSGDGPTRPTGRTRPSKGGVASDPVDDSDGGDGDQGASGGTAPLSRRRSGRLVQGASTAKKWPCCRL
jgi:hypothetical protein